MTETVRKFKLFPDAYVDSVVQLSATRAMGDEAGVEWAAAAMGTPANLKILVEHGFAPDDLGDASANDCFIAVVAGSEEEASAAAAAGESALFGARQRAAGAAPGAAGEPDPPSLEAVVAALRSEAYLTIAAVPGE